MMIAAGNNASAQVLRALWQHDQPQALQRRNISGFSAIHWSLRENVSAQVVLTLLMLDPTIATHLVCSSRPQDVLLGLHNKLSCLDILSQNKTNHPSVEQRLQEWDENQWTKLCYLLWARHYGSINVRSLHNFSTLHAALACEVAADLLDRAVEQDLNKFAAARDVYGTFALHWASQCRTVTGEHVHKIVTAYPNAAAIPREEDGRFPLHICLEQGKMWHKHCVQEIFAAHPCAAEVSDPTTQLPAALLAASTGDLDGTFHLMTAFPQAIAGCRVQDG